MNANTKKNILLIVSVFLSVLFLWLALRGTDIRRIGVALANANLFYVPLLFASLYVFLWLKAMRWAITIKPMRPITTAQAMSPTMIGYMGNLILPAYLSEIARIYIAGKQFDVSYTGLFTTVLLERLLDFMTFLVFLGVILIFEQALPDIFSQLGYLMAVVGLTMLVAVIMLTFHADITLKLAEKTLAIAPALVREKILGVVEKLPEGLQSIKSIGLLIKIIALSIIQWIFMGLCAYVALLALDLDVPVTAAFIILILITAGMSLPNSPGFFGTIQICFTLGLTPYAVSPDVAFAASLYYHLSIYVFIVAIGLFYLNKAGYTLAELKKQSLQNVQS